ncbi:MAG: UDP-N-acetylmuramoyl-L-alanyl-D-glutamate--2,6-diaminopimelate ligase [candidate division Zixibacteria bacterium]|nr:UDP-N-acetylmuramoyl-L-alanyl-D-glutamate--2,6-diaminopimelate ligase [candidate division Zixibacteria bacterium]
MNLAIDDNMISGYQAIKLDELFTGIQCDITGDALDIGITGLANDSRKVKRGDLFFAVPGYAVDGTKFIPEATSLGAAAVVTQSDINGYDYLPVIKCKNIRLAMSAVAARFYKYPANDLNVIGITGTNGKTTVTYLLAHILGSIDKTWAKIGTVEYFTGKRTVRAINTTPDTLELHEYLAEMRDSKMAGCVMEVSSHGLDQFRCDDIEYNVAVFTNLTQDHLDYHRNLENYFKAKSRLFTRLLRADGIAVLNANDSYYEKLRNLTPARIISYAVIADSSQTYDADITIEDEGYGNYQRRFRASFNGDSISGSMPYLGKFNLANAGATIAAAVGMGYDFKTVIGLLKNAPQVPGRVEKIEFGQPFEVVIDYAHTPDALENLLTGIETSGRKILVFGCGGDRDKTKRPIMGQVAMKYANSVIITSDNPRTEDPEQIIADIRKGITGRQDYSVIQKRDEAIGQALMMAKADDLVIIAGKGHEDYQVIGNARHYFSDPQVVKTVLKKMGYAGS